MCDPISITASIIAAASIATSITMGAIEASDVEDQCHRSVKMHHLWSLENVPPLSY